MPSQGKEDEVIETEHIKAKIIEWAVETATRTVASTLANALEDCNRKDWWKGHFRIDIKVGDNE